MANRNLVSNYALKLCIKKLLLLTSSEFPEAFLFWKLHYRKIKKKVSRSFKQDIFIQENSMRYNRKVLSVQTLAHFVHFVFK